MDENIINDRINDHIRIIEVAGKVKRLNCVFFTNALRDSKKEEPQYCVDDCSKCDNRDCMFGRKKKQQIYPYK